MSTGGGGTRQKEPQSLDLPEPTCLRPNCYMGEKHAPLSFEPLCSRFCHSRLAYILVSTDGSEVSRKQTGKVRFEIVLRDFFVQLKFFTYIVFLWKFIFQTA